jgi:hypothetical protein
MHCENSTFLALVFVYIQRILLGMESSEVREAA